MELTWSDLLDLELCYQGNEKIEALVQEVKDLRWLTERNLDIGYYDDDD